MANSFLQKVAAATRTSWKGQNRSDHFSAPAFMAAFFFYGCIFFLY
jgi:hypothetical protein